MGKKRDLTDALKRLSVLMRERNDRDAARERTLVEALKSMSADDFVIVTRDGHVVSARAINASVTSEPIQSVGEGGWIQGAPGPREYSAHVVITPIRDGG